MAIHLRHYGKIINGKKTYYNESLYNQTIRSLEGREFEEVIKEKHKKVSHDQHAYYRGGVLGTALEYEIFGEWNEKELHLFFGDLFLSYIIEEKYLVTDGTTKKRHVKRIESTADLSTKEMAQFIDHVIGWLAQQGIVVKDATQYYLEKYQTL